MPVSVKSSIWIIFITLLFALVSSMDLEDAERDESHYCEMVKSGAWPNFNHIDC